MSLNPLNFVLLKNSKFKLSKRKLFIAGTVFGLGLQIQKPLSPRQEAIVLGNILGDGHLQLSPNQKTTRLRFTHSMKQADYVKWQYTELDWLCNGVAEPKEIIEKNKYSLCRAYTAYRSELTPYHSLTYKTTKQSNRKFIKVLHENLGDYLKNPESLMIWYLDDGTLRLDGGACRLATQSFTLSEHEILQETLWNNFHVKTVIERWSKSNPSLYVPAREGHAKNFVSLFSGTVLKEIPSMKYKIQKYI